ncbi:protein fem-1 homolog C-like [Calliopsis andreniformis]|uniref:protein fem-1 homolog C-like n=1 Tax=Calliopsis andreniformis TaxID=337506 RepID=UPI003FCD54B3
MEIDQIFVDLIKECKYTATNLPLSSKLKKSLSKFSKDQRKEIVSRMENGCAPLFIACRRGNVKIAEYLIIKCYADVEQRGKHDIPNKHVYSVTPLWCAAVCGNIPVIKCLVKHGANVNAVSDCGSTPVRSACFMSNMDVVSYLVEHGADINKANHNGGTCLINSIQSVELCTFLLDHGADVNAVDNLHETALHYAIQENKLDTTKLLLEHKADPHLRSEYNNDALQTACLKGAVEIFSYLVKTISYSPERLADANELMGATLFHAQNDTKIALQYWQKAVTLRNSNAVNGVPLPKEPVLPKRDTYRNATEFTTLKELDAIASDFDAVAIQSLLICERILGPYHKETSFRLLFRGASYIDVSKYQYGIDLWRRALEIRVEKDSILYLDTCATAQGLIKIIFDYKQKMLEVINRQNKEGPRFSDIVAIFKLLCGQLTQAKKQLKIKPVYRLHQESYERIIKYTITRLIYLLVETGKTDPEKAITKQLVYELVKQDPRTMILKDTLLHLCVTKEYYYNDPKCIPHLETIELLLKCGADVNAQNIERSTPLHIASHDRNFENSVIKLLLDYGAHLDIADNWGQTPVELISSNSLNKVNLASYIRLQCLAAQVIRKYKIQWLELPVSLQHFVESHKEA